MPRSLHLELTGDQRRGLRALLARRDLARHTRLRAECVRLLNRGRTVTEVADLLECNPVTVRAAVHRFEKGRLDGLPDAPRPGRPVRILGPEDRAELADLLDASAATGSPGPPPPCATGSEPEPRTPAKPITKRTRHVKAVPVPAGRPRPSSPRSGPSLRPSRIAPLRSGPAAPRPQPWSPMARPSRAAPASARPPPSDPTP